MTSSGWRTVKSVGVAAVLLAGGWLAVGRGTAWADGDSGQAAQKLTPIPGSECKLDEDGNSVCPFDNGPDTIDVSKYPPEQQKNYKVFAQKCSRCHTLARPINSHYALPEEWKAYVSKMRHKRHSGISDKDEDKITAFLIYDSSVRKADLIKQKLKEEAKKPEAKEKTKGPEAKGSSK
ncbi:MAG: cytochrome c [Elusimicrobia bacterium]|nr:cytochrome c [Elusimicrobiota bacterium]MDE2425974.1 cytochrome c [Elusimicrobiota bacterium]